MRNYSTLLIPKNWIFGIRRHGNWKYKIRYNWNIITRIELELLSVRNWCSTWKIFFLISEDIFFSSPWTHINLFYNFKVPQERRKKKLLDVVTFFSVDIWKLKLILDCQFSSIKLCDMKLIHLLHIGLTSNKFNIQRKDDFY